MLRCQPCGIHAATAIPSGPLLFSSFRVMGFHKAMNILCKNNVGRKYWQIERDKEGRKYIKNIKRN